MGVITNKTDTLFDDFQLYELLPAEAVTRRIRSTSNAAVSGGVLTLDDSTRAGFTLIEGVWEDDLILQTDLGSERILLLGEEDGTRSFLASTTRRGPALPSSITCVSRSGRSFRGWLMAAKRHKTRKILFVILVPFRGDKVSR